MWTFYDRNGRERQAAVTTHPPGSIIAYGGSVAPPGWLICDGAEVPKATYAELFSIIGTTYNVNGSAAIADAINNFRLPDFRGHSPIGVGTPAVGTPGAGVTYNHGSKTGERQHALTVGEVPRHTHAKGTLATSFAATGVSINRATTGIAINNGVTAIAINDSTGHTHGWAGSGGGTYFAGFTDLASAPPSQNVNVVTGISGQPAGMTHTTGTIQSLYAFPVAAPQTDRLRATATTASDGVHAHTITEPNSGTGHNHGITEPSSGQGHLHTITEPNSGQGHLHTITGITEDGTAVGLGTGSPLHNNVSPVLPTNFIIKF